MRSLSWTAFLLLNIVAFCSQSGNAQTDPNAALPTEISADMGPCSALITVTGTDSKPIYDAKITTRVRYGLLGAKKLDLEVFTSVDGKVRITNLPETLKKPMYIYINKADRQEIVEFKPELRCHATFDVLLR